MCCPSNCSSSPVNAMGEMPIERRLSIVKVENGYKVELREDGIWKEFVFVEFMKLTLFLTDKLDVELDGPGLNALRNLVTINNFNVDKEPTEDGGRSRNRRG